jgi:uncharacterized RDD family membrane protein YckC
MHEGEAAMSQGQDWNAPAAAQSYEQPYQQTYQPPAGQVYPHGAMVPAGAYGTPGGMPGMAAPQVPPGFYYDQLSGLVLPAGTTLAPVGRRVGAYFLGALLMIVTLGIGYIIWGAISWANGQTPVQQVLGLQVWRPQEKVNATWGTMFLRMLSYEVLFWIPFAQIVSFFIFATNKEHRGLHDSIASVIVLHDPNKVLKPVQYQTAA